MDEGRGAVIDRRQLLTLGTGAGLAWLGVAGVSELAEAGKKKKSKRKGKGKKKNKGKNKKNKKQNAGKGNGSAIVKEAQKYKGTRYVSGGESPKGFDCSGFTWYVYNKVTGMDITRTVDSQAKQGKSVSNGSWQAGDILIFKNTNGKGLTHCGIFISGDKFIHAENEKTGVVISTFSDGYYKDHYSGARRLL
ncbi:MAG: NlpC/P60 family protein [Thermomicrobiales bacterium]